MKIDGVIVTWYLSVITDFLVKGHTVDLICLGFSKSFDMVSDRKLLVKVDNIGIRTKNVIWVKDWPRETKMDIIRRGHFRMGKGYL